MTRRRRRILYLSIGFSALAAVTLVAFVRWLDGPFTYYYGVKPIASVHGRTIYLKRSVASLFHDRTALSLNGARCTPPDYETDYALAGLGAGEFPLYYRLSDNGLTVYDNHLRAPTAADWDIAIEEKQISGHQPYFGGREQDYLARGLSEAQVLFSEMKPCEWWQKDYWIK
jgi:hypothetical protein